MANRVRLTVVTALAMLNVFALGAGVAVAALLPPRLALWQVPRVATVRVAAPAAVLTPAGPRRRPPTSQGLTAELAPLIASRSLGPRVGVVVTDLASGRVLFARAATHPGDARVQRQGGHRGGGAGRARPGRALHHPRGPRARSPAR